uniref:Peptidase S1 domain-containing protein n=1 Tax=Megaselia scalaris TaxID=36166 RepID=T1GJF5_MEGSC
MKTTPSPTPSPVPSTTETLTTTKATTPKPSLINRIIPGTVAGWGLTQEQGSTSSLLREVDVPIITNEECKRTKLRT